MPSKGKQRASRQAQLRNKRRKGRTQVVDSRRESTLKTGLEDEIISPAKSSSTTLPKQASIPRRAPVTSTTPGTSLTYEYLGGEIRQISIVATVIIALLVAFTFIPLG